MNTLVPLAQEPDDTMLQFFVVGNARRQRARQVLHRGRELAHINWGDTNFPEVGEAIVQQLGLKLVCYPLAERVRQKRDVSARRGQRDLESLAGKGGVAQRLLGANHLGAKGVYDSFLSKDKVAVDVGRVEETHEAPAQVRFIEQQCRL